MLSSCIRQEDENEYIIPKDTLLSILSDLHLADAYLSVNRAGFKSDKELFYKAILDSYRVDRERFDSTIHYYSLKGDQYESLYEDLLANLSTLEAEFLQEEQEKQKQLRDSLSYIRSQNLEDGEEKEIPEDFLRRVEAAKERKDNRAKQAKKTPLKTPGEK